VYREGAQHGVERFLQNCEKYDEYVVQELGAVSRRGKVKCLVFVSK
jgi:hypothetical protein